MRRRVDRPGINPTSVTKAPLRESTHRVGNRAVGFVILVRNARRVRARTGINMPLKALRVSSLTLISVAAWAQVTLNSVPSREVGFPLLPKPNPFSVTNVNPNLVEGREMFQPGGIALDTAATPPIVYVADSGNNRVLAWKNATAFRNGQPADLVIGQKDFYSTGPNGPGVTTFTTGLYIPTGLAVFAGDLYVSDTNNNRILRFRAPFSQPSGQQQIPDLCIGQPSFGSRTANAPAGQISASGLSSPGSLRFDSAGNLWVADGGNNRVLRYDAADVAKPSTPFSVVAKLEIGQLDFNSKAPALPNTDAGRETANQLAQPTAINFDAKGRLYVADYDPNLTVNMSRVLVYLPTFTNGMSATRIMGVFPARPAGSPAPTDPQIYSIVMNGPSDIFFLPGTQGMGVVDLGFSRILLFDSFENWPDQATQFSPSAKAVVGHASGISGINSHDQKSLVPNDGLAQGTQSSASTFWNPQAVVFFNNELFVADSGNNRILVLPYQSPTFQAAYRLLGQDRYDSNAPNLIEGKEFDFILSTNNGVQVDAGIAIDSTGDTPHLYVADPYNNRVLGFKDARKLTAGSFADIVIGQPDFATNICNYPTGDPAQPLQSNLCRPIGLLVDSSGNLYVADSRNSRVLRFPSPFSHTGTQTADVVLGQSSFFAKITDPSASTMGLPYGLAFAGNNGLLVSDELYNRVLFIPFTNGGFTSADNGKAATRVMGQPDFISTGVGGSDTGMNTPKHISADTDGRPYVVDAGNSRVLIFDQIGRVPATGAHAAVTLTPSSNNITGVFVNSVTGEIWVGDLANGQVLKYPKFDTIQFNPSPTPTSILAIGPLALVQDQYGDLIVAERISRVTFYFPALTAVNGATFVLSHGLAPNVFGTLFPASGGTFGATTAALPGLPVPTNLANLQVLLDGVACPLYFVSPGQINFLVPWGAATSGNSDLQVVNTQSGQVLAAGLVAMNQVAPAIFTIGNKLTATTVQAAVINQDNTVNSPTNPAARGSTISIYATGQGPMDGAPVDGALPGSPLSTSYWPRVGIGGQFTDSITPLQGETVPNGPGGYVTYSGTSGYPGVWQINVQIPMAVQPNQAAVLLLQVNSIPSNGVNVNGVNAVIYVK